MFSGAPSTRDPPKVPSKRLLFSKPSWSKSQNLGSSELFHRSDQIYVASTAEAERKRKEKLEKKETKRVREEESVEFATKRQRILDDEDDDGDNEDDDDDSDAEASNSTSDLKHALVDKIVNSPAEESLEEPNAPPNPPNTTTSLVSSYQRELAERVGRTEQHGSNKPILIDLDGEESPAKVSDFSKDKIEEISMTPALEGEATTSEEEFPELAKKAREKARKKRLEQDLASLIPDPPSSAECKPSYISPLRSPSPPPDPVLQILVTSSIPSTTPLIVSRRLSQRLKEVRLAWADRQQFSSGVRDTVFLTWRGKRLFDVTTCKSLGVTVDFEGTILAKDDVLGDDEGRIHMEAMTVEILEARKKAKMDEAANGEDHASAYGMQKPAEEKPDNQVRIILKPKGFADVKLKVKPVCPPELARQKLLD